MASKNLSFFFSEFRAEFLTEMEGSNVVHPGQIMFHALWRVVHFCLRSSGAWLLYSKIKLLLKGYSSYVSYAELSLSYAELVILN